MRIATENQLGEFLREIREVTLVRKHNEEQEARVREELEARSDAGSGVEKTKPAALDIGLAAADSPSFLNHADSYSEKGDADSDVDERDTGGETYVYGLRACAFSDEISSLASWSRRPDRLCRYHRDSHTTA